jgi:hypothetical protein
VRELLVRVVQQVNSAHAAAPNFPGPPPPQPGEPADAELQSAWIESLRESDAGDTLALVELFTHANFGAGDIALSPAAAEAVIRACARVRLHLRDTVLRELTADEAEGAADPFGLSPAEQQGYACFRLLAYLEAELLIQLDPGLPAG